MSQKSKKAPSTEADQAKAEPKSDTLEGILPGTAELPVTRDEDLTVKVAESGSIDRMLDDDTNITFEEWWKSQGASQLAMSMTRAEIKSLAQKSYEQGRKQLEDTLIALSNHVDQIEINKATDPTAHLQLRQLVTMLNREMQRTIG
jgi:hypothetical protein